MSVPQKAPWPCTRCGNPMASRQQYKRHGVRRARTTALCASCHQITHRLRGRLRGVGPYGDVDEVAVLRLLDGTLSARPSAGEIRQAVAHLTRCKLSARQIAERIGCTERTVQRHRAALRNEDHRGVA